MKISTQKSVCQYFLCHSSISSPLHYAFAIMESVCDVFAPRENLKRFLQKWRGCHELAFASIQDSNILYSAACDKADDVLFRRIIKGQKF